MKFLGIDEFHTLTLEGTNVYEESELKEAMKKSIDRQATVFLNMITPNLLTRFSIY